MLGFYVFVTSFLICFLVLPILIKFLQKIQFGDLPGGRKIHKEFTPSMGGIVIIFSFFVSLFIWNFADSSMEEIWFLKAGLVIIFFVGLSDDIVNLNAYYKLVGQLVAAFIVVVVGDLHIISFYGFLGIDLLPDYFSYVFSIFVLLAASNAFNLIDGVDGLAGTLSSIALVFLGIWFSLQDLQAYALFAFGLVGATLSFLIFNWQPAKIFMGDTGALTLGFALGVLLLVFFKENEFAVHPLVGKFNSPLSIGMSLMIYPLFDMIRIFVRRVVNGKHAMKADRGHLHHFLLRSGLSHQKVTIIISAVQLSLISLGLALSSLEDNLSLSILLGMILIFGGIVEQLTILSIRKRVLASPKILTNYSANLIPPRNIVEKQSVFSSKMNSN